MNGPLGFAEANNIAIVKIENKSPYLCFLNQDTVSDCNWVESAVKVMNGLPSIGAMSSLLLTYDGNKWDPNFLACVSGLAEFPLNEARFGSPGDIEDLPIVPAAAVIVKTELYGKKLGDSTKFTEAITKITTSISK